MTPDTAARVAKLVPLLSSDRMGEVAATAAAIERTLKANGEDWFALAAHIERVAPATVYINAMGMRTKPPSDMPPLFDRLPPSSKRAWLDQAAASDLLDDFERGLCVAMRAQAYCQPHKIITPKQAAAISTALGKLWLSGVRL